MNSGSVCHMEPRQVQELERLVDWRLFPFRDHAEYDDIRQEGLIAAWRAASQHPELRFATVVCAAARWGALEYLRSKRCRQPQRAPEEIPAPLFVSTAEAERFADPDQEEDVRLTRLLAKEIRRELWGLLRPRERQAIWLVYGLGYSWAEAGRRLGCNHRNVHRLVEQGLNRYRQRYGLPLAACTLNSRQRRELQKAG